MFIDVLQHHGDPVSLPNPDAQTVLPAPTTSGFNGGDESPSNLILANLAKTRFITFSPTV